MESNFRTWWTNFKNSWGFTQNHSKVVFENEMLKLKSLFEIHITTSGIVQTEIPKFVEFCHSIDAKPIIIELEKGDIAQQPMISKVLKDVTKEELYAKIKELEDEFENAGYEVSRTKVEVPLEFIDEGVAAFLDFKGKYFEWHGKVEFSDFEELKALAEELGVHLSNNSLKGEKNQRFLTLRAYDDKNSFKYKIAIIKRVLAEKGYSLTKEEAEYCVFDSNKQIDKGWLDTPQVTDSKYLKLLAYEGFLRRVSLTDENFIIKGSIITRQYLKNRNCRVVNDIDFVYGTPIDDQYEASGKFSQWVTKVTETEVDDDIEFRSFSENDFWRDIDYAMDDDFPTTNTDLYCTLKDNTLDALPLDITWNLPIEEAPIELIYHPIEGRPFILKHTVPLTLQISWKLHQSIVRPRAKDLMDIILLLENNKLTDHEVEWIGYHLKKECEKDNLEPQRLLHYIMGKVSKFILRAEKIAQDRWSLDFETKAKFGFEFYDFSFTQLKDTFEMELNYKSDSELVADFEGKLREARFLSFIEK